MAADDPIYARRRIDALTDKRLDNIEVEQRDTNRKLEGLDAKVDGLTTRLNLIAGGLAVLSVIANIVGPAIVDAITRSQVP